MGNKKDKEIKRLRKENDSLKEKLKAAEEKCYRYEREMANNSVVERWKIGKYLHDNLAQQLTFAKITLSLLRSKLSKEDLTTCDHLIEVIGESINDVRNLSHDILPMDVKREGIRQAFDLLKKQAESQYEVNCSVESGEILDKINRREVATNLYHIAQEAIKNAVVHGRAKNIKIHFMKNDPHLHLHIQDDGTGFDHEKENKGMGITIMRHRAEELGGALKIKEPDDASYNTCVICFLPLESLTGE